MSQRTILSSLVGRGRMNLVMVLLFYPYRVATFPDDRRA